MAGYIGYTGNSTALVRTSPGFLMYVDTENAGITPHLMEHGLWEPDLTKFFLGKDLKGKVCVDAGANAGYYSNLFGYKGASHIYTFEPIERLLEICRKSSVINGRYGGGTYHLYNKGLSDRAGYIGFTEGLEENGGSHIDPRSPESIEIITLDSLDIPEVHFMKIDVEGHEPQVLRGAKQTIARSPDIQIAAEFNPGNNKEFRNNFSVIVDELGLQYSRIISAGKTEPVNLNTENRFSEIILTHK